MSEIAQMLKSKRKELHLSVNEVLKLLLDSGIDISAKTLYGWESGHRQPDADTFLVLCRIYGINTFPQKSKSAPSVSDEALRIAKNFDVLDTHGKRVIRAVLTEETARMDAEQAKEASEKRTRTVPLFGNSFAAGTPEPDFGGGVDYHVLPEGSRADFAIRINGDSMEPWLKDGSIALGVKERPGNGEVGAFLLDGEFLCKQVCQDIIGNIYLFSLNRERADADITIWHDSGRNLVSFGKILMRERVPLP